jgi:hypothetical protein
LNAVGGRGPDPEEVSISLAFDDVKASTLRLRKLQGELERESDRWHERRARLRQVAGVDADISLERELGMVLAMRGGVPFWEREPAEP